jgi:hypothetical protein
MKYFLLLLLFCFFLRFNLLDGEQYGLVQYIAFSVFFAFIVVVLSAVSMVFISELPHVMSSLQIKITCAVSGVIFLFAPTMWDIDKISSDPLLIILSLLLITGFSVFGEMIFLKGLQYQSSLSHSELKKAFIKYPPTKFIDFAYFVLYLFAIAFMPLLVKYYWAA